MIEDVKNDHWRLLVKTHMVPSNWSHKNCQRFIEIIEEVSAGRIFALKRILQKIEHVQECSITEDSKEAWSGVASQEERTECQLKLNKPLVYINRKLRLTPVLIKCIFRKKKTLIKSTTLVGSLT
jgi:hypothetical protein